MKHIISIAGMHRSGTSLVTKWLNSCGLNLGKSLLKGDYTNPHGHFEDLEILQFHENVLSHHQETYFTSSSNISWTDTHQKTALAIINKKEGNHWAWKEPRTCLFLTEWKNLFPELFFIFVLRHPFEVARSLLKRELQMMSTFQSLFFNKEKYSNQALSVYTNYNLQILNYCRDNPGSYLLYDLNTIINNSILVIEQINGTINIDLSSINITDQLDKNLLNKTEHQISSSSATQTQALDVYKQLLSLQSFQS